MYKRQEPEPAPTAAASAAETGPSAFKKITGSLARLFDLEARVQLQSEALRSQTARVKSLTGKVKAGNKEAIEELKEARNVQGMMRESLGGLQKDLASAAEVALTSPAAEKEKKDRMKHLGTGKVEKGTTGKGAEGKGAERTGEESDKIEKAGEARAAEDCLLYTSPSPRD